MCATSSGKVTFLGGNFKLEYTVPMQSISAGCEPDATTPRQTVIACRPKAGCLVQSPGRTDCLGRSVRLPASHCLVGSLGLSRRVARQQSVNMHCLAGTLLGMFDYYDNGCFKMLNLPGTCPKSFQFSKSLAYGWSGPVKPDQLAFVKSSLL